MTSIKSPTTGKDGKEYPLTLKQHAFVNFYRESGNASDAYRRAYNTSAKQDVVKVNASKLLNNPKVQERLKQLNERQNANITITREMMIERALARAAMADAAEQYAAANQADALAAKLAELITDKIDQTVRQATPDEQRPDLSSLRQNVSRRDKTEQPQHTAPAEGMPENTLRH